MGPLTFNRERAIYERSISVLYCRCWSTETGKCLKILRGHQDTVNCIAVTENVAATGAMDKHVKSKP